MEEMNKMNLAQEKRKRLIDVVEGKKTDYIPTMLPMLNWIFEYSGIKFQEAMWDNKLLIKAYEIFFDGLEDADFDLVFNGYYPDFQMAYILGNERNNIFDSDLTVYQATDIVLMTEDEYPELIKDPYKFILEKILPRKYPRLSLQGDYKLNTFSEATARFIMSFPEMGALTNCINSRGCDHIPMGVVGYQHPLDMILDWRGIHGFSMDLRRHKSQIKDVIDAMFPLSMGQVMAGCFNPTSDFLSPVSIAGNFMNRKMMEEMFWPYFKQMAQTAANYGKKSLMFLEGDWTRFYDILADLPEYNCAIWTDDGDLAEAKKQWGNKITTISNMSSNYLGTQTKEECVNEAKKMLDDYAGDDAFVFSFDRILASPNDCNMENLKAVLKTVREYSR